MASSRDSDPHVNAAPQLSRRFVLGAALAAAAGAAVRAQTVAPSAAAPEGRSPAGKSDIIDCQVHANKFLKTAEPEAALAAVVGAMNALGITGLVMDEYTSLDKNGHMQPGAVDAQGSWIPHRPFSRLAVAKYPNRFRYLWRIDVQDPNLERLMRTLKQQEPGVVALRLHTGPRRVAWSDPLFASGGYAPYFEQAEKNQIPIFIAMAPHADRLAPYARQFPGLRFIVDHMGLVSGDEGPAPGESTEQRLRRFDSVLELSKYPNVAVKWCHIERLSARPYPYQDVMPGLRKLVDAFGAQRIMWASDATETADDRTQFGATWSQALHGLADTDLLSAEEKSWVLGRTARSILKWT